MAEPDQRAKAATGAGTMINELSELAELGWNSHYISQLDPEDFEGLTPVRVIAVHRSGLDVTGVGINTLIPPYSNGETAEGVATVGDWLLLDPATMLVRRMLDRKSLFKRRGAGTGLATPADRRECRYAVRRHLVQPGLQMSPGWNGILRSRRRPASRR